MPRNLGLHRGFGQTARRLPDQLDLAQGAADFRLEQVVHAFGGRGLLRDRRGWTAGDAGHQGGDFLTERGVERVQVHTKIRGDLHECRGHAGHPAGCGCYDHGGPDGGVLVPARLAHDALERGISVVAGETGGPAFFLQFLLGGGQVAG